MRLLLEVEAEINQADCLRDLKVLLMIECSKLLFFLLIFFFQVKKQALEEIVKTHSNVSLHSNHYLLTGTREKLIQVIMALRAKGNPNGEESLALLKYQVDLFKQVSQVMTKVDLPRIFWDVTLSKMEEELENLTLT